MPGSVANPRPGRHPVLPDMPSPRMAKADVQNPGMVALGRALEYAIGVARWSSKEAAAHIAKASQSPVDEAEFGKWLSGNRRVLVDKVLCVDELQWPFIVGLARECGHEVIEEIKRRHALPLLKDS